MKITARKSFDEYADEYDSALSQGLALSGEKKDYFARKRIEWIRDRMPRDMWRINYIMDYGCGTGSSVPLLLDILGAGVIVGTDLSRKSLDIAARKYGSERAKFFLFEEYQPDGKFDMVYCNGVFHHILPPARQNAVNYIYRSLRPGGSFAFWENNPWNPGTRLVMSRVTFDRDAITITARAARSLLKFGGFEILSLDFLFIFPRILRSLRWIEPICAGLPLGAQYQILCRKPMVPQ
jgi:SAM-dependent methyltransferase